MKKNLIIVMAFIMGMFVMNSCVKEYTITVGTNNAEWGTATGSGTYIANSEIQISAIPASGTILLSGTMKTPTTHVQSQ